MTSEQPLAVAYDTALLDLDGVCYVWPDAVPHAPEALDAARAIGMRLAFVTNNASRTPDFVARHLTSIGIPAVADDVVTSAQAAARYLAERFGPDGRVLVVGAHGLHMAVGATSLEVVPSADENPVAVVLGFNPTMTYSELAEVAIAIQRGAVWVQTNMDATVPTPRGPVPGNGALAAAVRAATGVEPVVAGKPEAPLHREGILRTQARRPLVVGDRLNTDIEGAVRGGADSLLVLSGVTTPATLVAAGPHLRPSFIAHDLRGLHVPHVAPTLVRGDPGCPSSMTCGTWAAEVRDGEVVLSGVGSSEDLSEDGRLDGLRAVCAAAWHARGSVDASLALTILGW